MHLQRPYASGTSGSLLLLCLSPSQALQHPRLDPHLSWEPLIHPGHCTHPIKPRPQKAVFAWPPQHPGESCHMVGVLCMLSAQVSSGFSCDGASVGIETRNIRNDRQI